MSAKACEAPIATAESSRGKLRCFAVDQPEVLEASLRRFPLGHVLGAKAA